MSDEQINIACELIYANHEMRKPEKTREVQEIVQAMGCFVQYWEGKGHQITREFLKRVYDKILELKATNQFSLRDISEEA